MTPRLPALNPKNGKKVKGRWQPSPPFKCTNNHKAILKYAEGVFFSWMADDAELERELQANGQAEADLVQRASELELERRLQQCRATGRRLREQVAQRRGARTARRRRGRRPAAAC